MGRSGAPPLQEGPGKVPGFLLGRDDPIVGNPVEAARRHGRDGPAPGQNSDDSRGKVAQAEAEQLAVQIVPGAGEGIGDERPHQGVDGADEGDQHRRSDGFR